MKVAIMGVILAGVLGFLLVSRYELEQAQNQAQIHLRNHNNDLDRWVEESNKQRKQIEELKKEIGLCDKQLSYKDERIAMRDAMSTEREQLYAATFEELRSARLLIEQLNTFLDGVDYDAILTLKGVK